MQAGLLSLLLLVPLWFNMNYGMSEQKPPHQFNLKTDFKGPPHLPYGSTVEETEKTLLRSPGVKLKYKDTRSKPMAYLKFEGGRFAGYPVEEWKAQFRDNQLEALIIVIPGDKNEGFEGRRKIFFKLKEKFTALYGKPSNEQLNEASAKQSSPKLDFVNVEYGLNYHPISRELLNFASILHYENSSSSSNYVTVIYTLIIDKL